MATLYVRDVPEDLYAQLKEQANAEGRSLSAETVALLRRALRTNPQAQRARLEAIKARTPVALPAGAPPSTELLREDRAR